MRTRVDTVGHRYRLYPLRMTQRYKVCFDLRSQTRCDFVDSRLRVWVTVREDVRLLISIRRRPVVGFLSIRYESGGRRFESFRARHEINDLGLSGGLEKSLCPRCVRNRDGGRLEFVSHRMWLWRRWRVQIMLVVDRLKHRVKFGCEKTGQAF